jgi:hypothetical protein
MVGPNPHKPYSYAEAIAMFGTVYVVCWHCMRYAVFDRAKHGDRDTRRTTFSCVLCGGNGHSTQEMPPSHVREDTRADPKHHPKALSRLTSRPVRPSVALRLRERPRR